jgi:antimicrobial peptide system SdpA family protein
MIDSSHTDRGTSLFTQPFVAGAAAIAMDRCSDARTHRWPVFAGFGLAIFVYACFVAMVLVFYFPKGPLSPELSISVQQDLRQVLPEGWAFFTKSPRDPEFALYRRSGNSWVTALHGPQSDVGNWFGLSRKSRAEGIEFGMISVAVGKRLTTCSGDWQDCAKKLRPNIVFQDTEEHPLLCGSLLIVNQTPVPWSWATFQHVTMPSTIAYVDVRCR